jgi:hypothetical protein
MIGTALNNQKKNYLNNTQGSNALTKNSGRNTETRKAEFAEHKQKLLFEANKSSNGGL